MKLGAGKRAVSEEQKQARRNSVLVAAGDLFLQAGYFEVSMSMIAKKAGIAKGTIYIYFQTKEELFLSLLLSELGEWFENLRDELRKASVPLENNEFVEILRDTFLHRIRLQRLISLMHLILEKNVSYDEAFAFKRELLALMRSTSPLIEKALPYLPENGGNQVLIEFHSLLIGWSHITETSPIVERVQQHPEIQGLKFELEDALFNSLSLVLDGMKYRSIRREITA
ncbi:TetR family transcriptional regulator [Sneathiella glossodoripedis]|uniref:TetR family transcriptional regulator n=1 Tax=Sneathiella glossodoripedis TaxID=418853 RepID=UPI0005694076|nr:TetR family transcriptional regulator [Sneathiella glossodoripedis]